MGYGFTAGQTFTYDYLFGLDIGFVRLRFEQQRNACCYWIAFSDFNCASANRHREAYGIAFPHAYDHIRLHHLACQRQATPVGAPTRHTAQVIDDEIRDRRGCS